MPFLLDHKWNGFAIQNGSSGRYCHASDSPYPMEARSIGVFCVIALAIVSESRANRKKSQGKSCRQNHPEIFASARDGAA